ERRFLQEPIIELSIRAVKVLRQLVQNNTTIQTPGSVTRNGRLFIRLSNLDTGATTCLHTDHCQSP
ncbi:hypothetical protein, partial [Thiolapillus sp.]